MRKYHPLLPQERASLCWQIDEKTKGPTLWVKEVVIVKGKKTTMTHWVVDASLFKTGSLFEEKDHVEISFEHGPNWKIVAIPDLKNKKLKIVRTSKEIYKIT